MGEAPPYTAEQIARLLDRATFKGVHEYGQNTVVFVLEKDGERIELEVYAQADWDGPNDYVEAASVYADLTVYIRGVDLGDG
jgi:hypothetical protein